MHPLKAELRAYAADQLTKREAASIIAHITDCDDCRRYERAHRIMLKRWREYFKQSDQRLLKISNN